MKLRFAALGLLVASTASAQVPIKPTTPITPGPVIKAPIDLGGKRPTIFNSALARGGLPALNLPPPPAYAKLTPIAPTTNGARIIQAGGVTFVGASPERPEGLFIIEGAPAGTFTFPGLPNPIVMAINIPKGTLKFEFQAAANQLYFIDCRISLAASNLSQFSTQSPITFARSGSTTSMSVPPEDGHFIYAFRTGAIGPFGAEWVQLTIPQTSYFFGCEITKGS